VSEQNNSEKPNGDDRLDVLHGAENIGAYLGLNERQTFYLLERGKLPAKKLGGKWITTKQQLRRVVEVEAS
jgi:hypothetical protein